MNYLLFDLFSFASDQTPAERTLSIFSVILLVILFLYMAIDVAAKGKYVPKHKGFQKVIIVLFTLSVIFLILMKIYY